MTIFSITNQSIFLFYFHSNEKKILNLVEYSKRSYSILFRIYFSFLEFYIYFLKSSKKVINHLFGDYILLSFFSKEILGLKLILKIFVHSGYVLFYLILRVLHLKIKTNHYKIFCILLPQPF